MLKHTFLLIAILLLFSGSALAQISLIPHGFGVTMEENENADAELILINDYEEPVSFSLDYRLVEEDEERREGPRRDEPGDLLNEFQSPLNQIGGMAFDGELLWGSSYGSDQLCAMTLEGEQIRVLNINDAPLSMTFDGELLWCCNWNSREIFLYDLEGQRVEQFNVNFGQCAGMASDQEDFVFMNSGDDDRIHVISIEDHQEVASFAYRAAMANADIWGIEWVPGHREGQLWGNVTGHLYQASVDDEWNVEAVSDFVWNTDQSYNDPCHDGENMWHGMWGTNVWYQFDDGVAEFFMLTFDPEEGEVPGEDSIPIEVFITSEDVDPGVYNILVELETDRETIEFTAIVTVDSPSAFLTCRAIDAETEEVLPNIRIDVDRYNITRFTNRNGICDFETLPTGEYEFTFSGADYLTHVEPYRIDGEGELFLRVELLHAECNPDRDNINAALESGASLQTEITISNNGNGPLAYTTEKRLLGDANAEPWELRRTLNVGEITGDTRIQGVIFIDDLFYVSGANANNPLIYVINRDGEVVNRFEQFGDSPYGFKDLCYDGELIWAAGENDVYGFTTDGELVASFASGYRPCTNIAWDSERELFWISTTTTDILGLDREGNQQNRLSRLGLRIYGLAFWPDDPDGYQLYIYYKIADVGDQVLTKMNLDNGDTLNVVILEPETDGGAQGCFITNQYDIYSWVFMGNVNNGGNDRIGIWQIDARKDWMEIEPEEGIIEAEEAQEFVITLDATGLPEALFEGEIVFNHDGVGSRTPIRISLQVSDDGGGEQGEEMILNFVDGWNMVSAHVQPDPDDIVEIMRELVEAEQLRLMKDGAGHFYNPAFDFNNIPGWRVNEGYMVNVDGDAEMTISGNPVNADDPLPLIVGWQMVSYYPRRGIDAIVALSGIRDLLIIAKDAHGRFYNPEFNFSNMGNLEPGQGYLMNLREAVELVYNLDDGLVSAPSNNYLQPRLFPIHPITSENMSLLVLTDIPHGEIGVYAKGNFVGSGVIQDGKCGLAVWGDDQTTPEIDGALEGESIELSLHLENGTTSSSPGARIFYPQFEVIQGDGLYRPDGFQAVRLAEVELLPDEFGIVTTFPNPFNNRTSITYNLLEAGNVRLSVYNVLGETVVDLIDDFVVAGNHKADLNGKNLASGIYYVKLSAGKNSSIRKIVLMR